MQTAVGPRHDQQFPKRTAARIVWSLLVVLMVAGGVPPARSADLGQRLEDNPDEPWHITADTISYDNATRRYVAEGNVRISRGGVRLTADRVRFDNRTMDAAASGHVVLVSGKDVLIGDTLEINLQNQVGSVTNGTIFLEENHFYIRGEKIEKLGESTYAAERASVSSCDGRTPAWKITGRKLNVTLEGYGVVRDAALWARDVPLLYTPIFVFPAKRQRQTGLLPPEWGTSDRLGIFYTQPFFWAIDEQSDLTYAPQYLSERGLKNNLEYRYVIDPLTRGTIMGDYLRDRQVDNGLGDSSTDWGYVGDDYLRPNEDRYWFRMKHDQGLPYGFKGRVDLDIVSDQDYLTEFRNRYGGYYQTREYFRSIYGRDLDDYDDPIRTNQAVITREWDRFSLNGGIIWMDDTTRRWTQEVAADVAGPKLDTQLQRLPLIRFDAIRQPLGDTPLLFNMDTEWTYFYSADNTQAARVNLHPRVTWPFRLGQALYIEPSAGLQQTAWFVNQFQDIPSEEAKDKDTYRTLYDLRLDVSSELSKVYAIDGGEWQALRHTVLPRVVYEYIPEKDQDKYPAFYQQIIDQDEIGDYIDVPTPLDDGINRVDPLNMITYSITNSFTSKSIPSSEKNGDDGKSDGQPRYRDFLRVKLEQRYNIREARGSERVDPARKRPFSPIRGELEYFPTRYLKLRADAEFDVYDSRLVSRNLSATLDSPRGDELYLRYRYDKGLYRFYRKDAATSEKRVESLYGRIRLKLPYRFTVHASNEYDFVSNTRIETTLGLLYAAQCWSLDVQYSDADNDQAISFMFNFYGLGPIGLQ